jgi:hypothetical protein
MKGIKVSRLDPCPSFPRCARTTCAREEMKRYMQFRTRPRRLPTVPDIEEVAEVIAAAPGPGLKYRAALSIRYGAGLRASAQTVMTIAADPKHLGARVDMTSVLHTWGSAMTHPPMSR